MISQTILIWNVKNQLFLFSSHLFFFFFIFSLHISTAIICLD
jgi:hypothetical protein